MLFCKNGKSLERTRVSRKIWKILLFKGVLLGKFGFNHNFAYFHFILKRELFYFFHYTKMFFSSRNVLTIRFIQSYFLLFVQSHCFSIMLRILYLKNIYIYIYINFTNKNKKHSPCRKEKLFSIQHNCEYLT